MLVNDQLLTLALEFSVSTTTTCKTVGVFSHEGALLATGTGLLGPSDIPRLVNLVYILRLCHLRIPLSFNL